MASIAFWLLLGWMITSIILSSVAFKDTILRFYLGNRRKRALFIDLRMHKWVTLDKTLNQFEAFGVTFNWNYKYEKNNSCAYDSKCAEAVDIELSTEKCKYWIDTQEYHTNLKNDLLKTLMMLKAKDTIIAMLMLILVVTIIFAGFMYLKTGQINEQLNTLIEMAKKYQESKGVTI